MLRTEIAFGLLLLAGGAFAQVRSGPPPPVWPAPAAGGFTFQRGPDSLSVRCAEGEKVQACADAAGVIIERFRAIPPGPAPGPPFTAPATPARPVAAAALPDVVPALWTRPSPGIDPRRLPLGDGRMVVDAPRKGSVYACDPFMYSMPTVIGARVAGPWIDSQAGTYDVTRKVFDRGRVEYAGRLSVRTEADRRVISGNGLPVAGVPTGVFPVPAEDPAYRYDRNPNPIAEQAISFAVPLAPSFGPAPRCVYKEVGITLDGVPLHTGLDSSGRDENAYELNDTCGGKPQPGGGYHRSVLSDCTPGIALPGVVVGYALDGFAITGPYRADGTELASADLDECHGTTSEIVWEGQRTVMYHYVLTRDFPYSVACFRGTPTRNAFPPLPGAPPQFR